MDIIIKCTDTQLKVFLADALISPQEWLQHCWDNKCRKVMDSIINISSNYNPDKLDIDEKSNIIDNLTFEVPSEERQLKSLADRIIEG